MIITTEREKFFQCFQLAASVAAAKDVKPVLQNVKLKVDSEGVFLMATDSEIGIKIACEGTEIEQPGEAILPAKQMRRILQESRVDRLQIKDDGGKMVVKGSGLLFKLESMSPEEFPDVESHITGAYHEIPCKIMRELIRRTCFAIDDENTRYSLGGVLLELEEDRINAVATDGRRLAFQAGAAECFDSHQAEGSSIFPVKTLNLIEKAMPSDDSKLKLAISANRAYFETGGIVLFTQLIEGRFPRWRNIIPGTDGRAKIDIMAGALFAAVRQAAIVTSDKLPGVVFRFANGKLELSGHGAEIGESNIEVPISYEGPELTVKMDPKFMEDFLRVLDSETTVSLYIENEEPVLCRTEDDYSYVIMPLSN